jgi:2-polyprenyl-3-methyl-5-hydroxy-6-metoxy-1,4-benzoquinol methylase
MTAPTANRSKPCPICGGTSRLAFRVGDRNRNLSAERFRYFRCQACHTYFNADTPADLSAYYPADYYRQLDVDQLDASPLSEVPRVQMITELVPSGRLVEVGAGTGSFARAAKQAGFEVTAIEMNQASCEYMSSAFGVTAVCSDAPAEVLAQLPPSDVVAMWHSLEHMVEPWAVVDAAVSNLRAGGVLAVAMPNPQAIQFRLLRRYWVHVDAPRHLYLIPLTTLVDHLSERGVRLATATCDDPIGRYLNRLGWERALATGTITEPPIRVFRGVARVFTALMRPLERRPAGGAAYTAVFVKDG